MAFADSFIHGFDVGHKRKLDQLRLEQEAEDRKLMVSKHKLEIDRIKIHDKEAARKASFDEAEFYNKMFEVPGGTEVQVPEGGYGQPATSIQPTGMKSHLLGLADIERQKRMRTVSPELSKAAGVPAGEYDADVLREAGDTARTTATRASTEREGALNRQNQLRVASIYSANKGTTAAAGGGTPEAELDNWAKMLNSGEATLSQVPLGRNGSFRNAVIQRLMGGNMAVMTPKMQEKLTQFIPANAAVDKIEETLSRMLNSEGLEKGAASLQLAAEVKGLSRLVGRSIGEKGVFTDQDKNDFATLMMPGGSSWTAPVIAMMAPEMAADRLKNLRALMARVKQREFAGVEERTGGRTLPGSGQEEPTWIIDAQGNPVRNPRKK
jgi:hypothetical protein